MIGAYTGSAKSPLGSASNIARDRAATAKRSQAMDNYISRTNKTVQAYTNKNAPSASNMPRAASMGADIAAPTSASNRTSNVELNNSNQGNISATLNATPVAETLGFGSTEREQEINRMGDIENSRVYAEYQKRLKAQQQSANKSFAPDGTYGDFNGTGDGSGLDSEQLQNARLIASVGKQRGMNDQAIQIAIMTAMTESSLRNVNYGDNAGPDSRGLFQQRSSQGWGTMQQIMDPTYAANKFYDTLASVNYGGMSPWQAAQAVQRSAFSDGSNYQKNYQLAQQAFNSIYNPQQRGGAVTGSNSAAGWINANNNKYHDYDGAYGAQCVDLYAFYTTQFSGGTPNPVGYAPEIFNNYDSKAYAKFGANQRTAMGDVAVFGVGPQTPYGHVGIVVGDNGDGTLRLLQANATSLGSAGNTVISNISKASLYGYLRPRKLM